MNTENYPKRHLYSVRWASLGLGHRKCPNCPTRPFCCFEDSPGLKMQMVRAETQQSKLGLFGFFSAFNMPTKFSLATIVVKIFLLRRYICDLFPHLTKREEITPEKDQTLITDLGVQDLQKFRREKRRQKENKTNKKQQQQRKKKTKNSVQFRQRCSYSLDIAPNRVF